MAVHLYNRSKEPRDVQGDDGQTYHLFPRCRETLPEGVEVVGPLPKDVKITTQTN